MGLSDQIKGVATWIGEKLFTQIEDLFTPMACRLMSRHLTKALLDPKKYTTPAGQAIVARMQAGLTAPISDPATLAGLITDVAMTKFGKVQIEGILAKQIPTDAKSTDALFSHIALVQDITLLSNALAILGEVVPTTQLGQVGMEIREFLQAGGMGQIAGLGVGMILQPLMQERIQKELFPVFTPKILQENDILRGYIRGILSKEDTTRAFGYLGYSQQYTDMMLSTAMFYPQAQDFIRFAVRDVFTPAIVESGKLMDMYPKDIEPYAAKAGMTPDVLKWYWAAHWELPSPQMGYEMLHRRIITQDQLRSLLKTADFAPGWIDPMISISYAPLTRVDARNMYINGVLTDKEFLLAMKDIGYNDLNAQRLLDYVSVKVEPPQRDLTQATMITSYKLGLISAKQLTDYLMLLGYDQTEADLLLAIEDRKAEQDLITEKLEALKYQYSTGAITLTDFVKACGGLGIPETKAQAEAMKAEQGRIKSVSRPTKEDILAWLKAKQITQDRARDELRKLGYASDYITLYTGGKLS